MGRGLIVAALLALAVAACGGGGGEAAPNLATKPPGGSEQAVEGDTITGTFGGDPKLEGGCAWVDDGKTRWNVQYPQGYKLTLKPLKLTGPNNLNVGKGDVITVTGSEQSDVMTTCQIGPVWVATSVAPQDE